MPKIASVILSSTSEYSQSKYIDVEKNPKERPDDYEERTWRHRAHFDKSGRVFIPGIAFKNCLASAAKYMSEQIPGKGKSTFTKHFLSGVMVAEDIPLDIKVSDIEGKWLLVPSDGVRGGGKRVKKCFPTIDNWKAEVKFIVLDDTITEEVFIRTLKTAGMLTGIGSWRPQNGGMNGTFKVESYSWGELDV